MENARELARSLHGEAFAEEFTVDFGDYVHAIELEDLVKLLKASGFTIIASQVDDFPYVDDFGRTDVLKKSMVMVVAEAGAPATASYGPGDGKSQSGSEPRLDRQ
jgi:hypothetical protein